MKLFSKAEKSQHKNTPDAENRPQIPREKLASALNLPRTVVPEGYIEVARYPLQPPFTYAVIVQNSDGSDFMYVIDELQMNSEEEAVYNKLKDALESELSAPNESEKADESFHAQLSDLFAKHAKGLKGVSNVSMKKIQYNLTRNILGFERIDPLMHDPGVEDISCAGLHKPVFVWHKNFESLRTNISYDTETALDDFIVRLVHRAGKHVSTAFPVVDVTLPGKHRLAVLYRREITPLGTSFTIRKFREDPYTMIDLMDMGTVNEDIAAYLWLLMEHKMAFMVLGSTGAGKTTSLNALTCFIPPSYKVFTVEEVAEINLFHENWYTLVSRSSFGLETEGQISLFDLIKSAVRHRPDYIVVGEVRGDEAYVLFQALATGHGGLCTMHGDSVDNALRRLTQKPMNIPPASIPLMNCAIVIKRVRPPVFHPNGKRTSTRRFVQVTEITGESSLHEVFTWNPSADTFTARLTTSALLQRVAAGMGVSFHRILQEHKRRKTVLRWMAEQGIRDYRQVGRTCAMYQQNPDVTYQRAVAMVGQ